MRMFGRGRRSRDPPSATASSSAAVASTPEEFAAQSEALIPAAVRMISGCHSEQTSADVSNVNSVEGKLPSPAGRSGGACTSALLGLLYKKPKTTFQQLLLDLRESLSRSGFDQIPQLTSSRNLDLQETPFSLVGPGGGTRRAVLVGINYNGQSGQLSGCHNDVLNMKKYLIEQQGYLEHNILVLIDDGRHHYPTRDKVIRALQQLVAQSVPGDSAYFHYSGHGGLLSPTWNAFKSSNKEYDETVYPVDHERAGNIRDFSLFNHFVKPMSAGVTVTCVMDCCHSGSVLDLPYTYQPTKAGTIRMRQGMDTLSNLAFLHILSGGILPMGFGNVAHNIESTTGGNIEDFQGMGLDEFVQDTETSGFDDPGDYGDAGDYAGDVADSADDVPDVADGGDFGDGFGGDNFGGGEAVDRGMMPDMGYGDGMPYGDDQDYSYPVADAGGDAADDVDCSDCIDCGGNILNALLEDD